ncbi:hypothetical protein [Parvularcula dongshanensis]|nr:hypothetical protein [Parvularcula dongshanensis]
MNAAYRAWSQEQSWPTYYACLDLVVGLSHASAITDMVEQAGSLGIEQFLLRRNLLDAAPSIRRSDKVLCYDDLPKSGILARCRPVTTGSHAALWGAELGYEEVVLLGIDGRYVEMLPQAKREEGIELRIQRQAANPNYYFDEYQQVGDRYCVPNPGGGTHAIAWRRAARALDQRGVTVLNGSKASAIDRFETAKVTLVEGRLDVARLGCMPPGEPPAERSDPHDRVTAETVLSALAPAWYGRLWDPRGIASRRLAQRFGWRVLEQLPSSSDALRWDVLEAADPDDPNEDFGGVVVRGGGANAASLAQQLDQKWDLVAVLRRQGARVRLGAPDGSPLAPQDVLVALRERWPPMPSYASALEVAARPPHRRAAAFRRFRSWRSRAAQRVRSLVHVFAADRS